MKNSVKNPIQRTLALLLIIALTAISSISRAQEITIMANDPISQAGFGAKPLYGQYVIAYWNINAGQNDTHFNLERSTDGIHFETLEEVDGQIAQNKFFQYSFLDQQPQSETSYYRLRITSQAREISYSMAKRVQLKQTEPDLKLSPASSDEQLTANNRTTNTPVIQQAP